MSATWPECPTHPNTHPLEAALLSDRAVWRCPKNGEVIAEIGTLQADFEDNDDLGPADYEALTGLSKVEYELAFLQAARRIMLGPQLDGYVQSVELDDAASMLVVLFGVHHLPGRVFGWRVPMWPASQPRDVDDASADFAVLLPVYLMELINDLPHAVRISPDESGVEWVDPAW
jgi:hypothetical protein